MTVEVCEIDDTENDNTMRYVEPYTQRASLVNIAYAEPMEIGPQSSANQSLQTVNENIDEVYINEVRLSPFKSSMNDSPSKFNQIHEAKEEQELMSYGKSQPSHEYTDHSYQNNLWQYQQARPTKQEPLIKMRVIEVLDPHPQFFTSVTQQPKGVSMKFADAFSLYEKQKGSTIQTVKVESMNSETMEQKTYINEMKKSLRVNSNHF